MSVRHKAKVKKVFLHLVYNNEICRVLGVYKHKFHAIKAMKRNGITRRLDGQNITHHVIEKKLLGEIK